MRKTFGLACTFEIEICSMKIQTKIPFFTLLLMISFASVNAVLFTPSLPDMAHFFGISNNLAEHTITWFLIGYALGQLIYGPFSNRFGTKPALYAGVILQIISSLVCVFAGILHVYSLLILARFTSAIGSGVGLKMAFMLVNTCYEPKVASQKISYLMLSFAIAPGLAIAIGGILNTHFGWMSCFYADAVYGLILLLLLTKLPEIKTVLDKNALKINNLLQAYRTQFKNRQLVSGGLLMGSSTTFIYVFSAIAPFVAINLMGMTSTQYGIANVIPAVGLILGSLCSARLVKQYPFESIIGTGILITSAGVILMVLLIINHLDPIVSLFLPMVVIYFGLALILPNTSTIAMSQVSDKSNGAAVMSFINMGLTTFLVLGLGIFSINVALLPIVFIILCIAMEFTFRCIFSVKKLK
jgi:MFS transporter, DHA1 family, multidrug resistance protein